jgi:hypothetical protein
VKRYVIDANFLSERAEDEDDDLPFGFQCVVLHADHEAELAKVREQLRVAEEERGGHWERARLMQKERDALRERVRYLEGEIDAALALLARGEHG